MKDMLIYTAFTLFASAPLCSSAQTQGRDFKEVDAYVKTLGTLDSMTMGTISNTVSLKFPDKIDKARAIYDWITANINFDLKAAHSNNTAKNSPAEVLISRKAVGIGFASLFQDMCSSANIRCLTVDGYVKTNVQEIGENSTEINHSWAVVQLGESPDTWFYVDPAMGSGYPDAEMKTFTKAFNEGYFFADKQTFNWQHFPDNGAWKLGPAPHSRTDFFELPIIRGLAYELGMKSISPRNGHLKIKLNSTMSFSYKLNLDAPVGKVTLLIGEKKKQQSKEVNASFSGGMLNFSFKFEKEGSFPVAVLIDGKELISYMADVD